MAPQRTSSAQARDGAASMDEDSEAASLISDDSAAGESLVHRASPSSPFWSIVFESMAISL